MNTRISLLYVVGHTDDVSTLASNLESKGRAQAVVNALKGRTKSPPI